MRSTVINKNYNNVYYSIDKSGPPKFCRKSLDPLPCKKINLYFVFSPLIPFRKWFFNRNPSENAKISHIILFRISKIILIKMSVAVLC